MKAMVDESLKNAVVKNTPEKIAELHETRKSVERQRNMSAKYWIRLNFGGDVSDTEILDLVKQSYEIVKSERMHKENHKHINGKQYDYSIRNPFHIPDVGRANSVAHQITGNDYEWPLYSITYTIYPTVNRHHLAISGQ